MGRSRYMNKAKRNPNNPIPKKRKELRDAEVAKELEDIRVSVDGKAAKAILAVEKVAERFRKRVILPFCQKHRLVYSSESVRFYLADTAKRGQMIHVTSVASHVDTAGIYRLLHYEIFDVGDSFGRYVESVKVEDLE